MNKRITSLLLALVMILGLVPGMSVEASAGDPFTDVPEGSFYEEPILWALENGITTGTSATTFNPGGVCQRAAVVTFLWRAAGMPDSISDNNPFVDVRTSDFFYEAVLWAVEKGITNGSDETHFNPYGVCDRAQVVTFLYRAKGSPASTDADLPFNDVPAGAWFAAPVAWAVESGITNGLSASKFGPNVDCNRAQVVTFLYRAYFVKKPVCTHAGLQALEANAPTCTEPGNTACWYCADCGKYFDNAEATSEIGYDGTIIAATGHTPDAQTACTEDQVCTVCGEVLAAATGHDPGDEATCTEGQVCTVCGEVLATANGHIPGAEATCTEPQRCLVCQTVLAEATGHSLTYVEGKEPTYEESGNWAYWCCSVCGSYFSDEACKNKITYNDTIRPAKEAFSITYYLYDYNQYLEEKGVENPNQTWYDPEEGLVLENLSMLGFRFDGWYDAEGASGELVREIKVGERGNKKLYARWSTIEFYISYKDDIYKVNYGEDTYTVDKRKTLLYPEQMGYEFVGWEDKYGNVYTELPQGTTGYLELTAKWKDHLYNAYVYDDQKTVAPFYYDENLKTYYFVYALGELEGILLEDLLEGENVYKHTGGTDTEFSWSDTVTIEESKAQTIGKTISKATSKSEQWEEQKTTAKEESAEAHMDFTFSPELGMDPIKLKLEAAYGGSQSTTNSYEVTEVKGGSEDTEEGESEESSVTLSYLREMSVTKGTNVSIPADKPAGYYSYTKLGNAKVYGLVAFNCETGNYSMTTYSILEYSYPAHLYFHSKESLEQSMKSPDVESIPFDVPVKAISDYIEQHWYVNYYGNGGTYSYTVSDKTIDNGKPITVNSMPVSEFLSGSGGVLAENLYTKTGYTFVGWALTPDGDVVYKDKAEISVPKTDRADVLSLYAVWEKNPYTIEYVANKPEHASAEVQNMPADTPCRYDTDVTLGSEPTLTGWNFCGWYLEDPTHADAKRIGDAGEVIPTANLTTEPGGTVKLYAKWIANSHNVTLDANGGTVSTSSISVTYDGTYSELPADPIRTDYIFLGWQIQGTSTIVSSGSNVTTDNDHTLVAQWTRVTATVSGYSNKTVGRDDVVTDTIEFDFDRDTLLKKGYTKISISISFTHEETNLICHNASRIQVLSRDEGTEFYYEKWDPKASEKSKTVTLEIELDKLGSNCSFLVRYSTKDEGGAKSDGWYLRNRSVTVEAK